MEGTLRKAGPLPSSVDDQLTCDGPFVRATSTKTMLVSSALALAIDHGFRDRNCQSGLLLGAAAAQHLDTNEGH
jgi:hypothetical protein